MNRQEADYEAAQGSVGFVYPDDEPAQESTAVDLRKVRLQSLEWATKFILSGRTDTIRHMRASIGLMLLRGETPNVGEIASHFNRTWTRVEQVIREMKFLSLEPHK